MSEDQNGGGIKWLLNVVPRMLEDLSRIKVIAEQNEKTPEEIAKIKQQIEPIQRLFWAVILGIVGAVGVAILSIVLRKF